MKESRDFRESCDPVFDRLQNKDAANRCEMPGARGRTEQLKSDRVIRTDALRELFQSNGTAGFVWDKGDAADE